MKTFMLSWDKFEIIGAKFLRSLNICLLLHPYSGVSKGGHLPLGAAFWERSERCIMITKCQMSVGY